MSRAQSTPVVPLEAGAGPENPPCPACGEPLFGWLAIQPGLRGPVRRCESCGLGVVGDDAEPAEALRELDLLARDGRTRIPNRASLAAAIGEAGWSGLEAGSRYLFTVEAVRRLVARRDQVVKSSPWTPGARRPAARRDQVVKSSRWTPGASLAAAWQTLLNSVTFGHDVALGALGRAQAAPAGKPWQRRIDALISVVLAIPAAVIALPLELIGAALRRGSVLSLRFELL